MTTSVIIPTYNGAHKILGALRSLEKQKKAPDEVIVVIDGSTDGTGDFLRNSEFNLRGFKIIEQANEGRAKVRNRGALAATGELLLFLDDDMIVPSGWTIAHVEHHSKTINCLLTGKLESESQQLAGEFKIFEEWQNRKWNEDITQSTDDVVRLNYPYVSANNFSISKNLFVLLKQFDERLNDAEDYDLAVKAAQAGYPIYFSKKAFAYHYDIGLKNFRSYIRRIRQYREAQEQLVSIKPELYGEQGKNIRFPVVPTGVKGRVFGVFARRFWIRSLEQSYWKWLPKNARCKLYDIIVTANGVFFPDRVRL